MITFMNLKRDSSKAKKLIRKTMITCQALESTQTCELSRGSITRFQKHVVSVFTPFKNVAAKKHLNILSTLNSKLLTPRSRGPQPARRPCPPRRHPPHCRHRRLSGIVQGCP